MSRSLGSRDVCKAPSHCLGNIKVSLPNPGLGSETLTLVWSRSQRNNLGRMPILPPSLRFCCGEGEGIIHVSKNSYRIPAVCPCSSSQFWHCRPGDSQELIPFQMPFSSPGCHPGFWLTSCEVPTTSSSGPINLLWWLNSEKPLLMEKMHTARYGKKAYSFQYPPHLSHAYHSP